MDFEERESRVLVLGLGLGFEEQREGRREEERLIWKRLSLI